MQDIELPLPQNFTKYSHPWRRMPCPHPPIARRGWFAARRSAGPLLLQRGVSVSVRWCHAGEERREGGREGKSLILSPRVESSQRLRFIPKKRKEGERKEKGLQQRKEERTSRGRPEKTSKVPPESDEKTAWESQGPISQAGADCDREKGGKDSWRGLPHSMQPFRLLSRGSS